MNPLVQALHSTMMPVIRVRWRVGGVGRERVQLLRRGTVIKKHFIAEPRTIQMRFSCSADLFSQQRCKKLNTSSRFCLLLLNYWCWWVSHPAKISIKDLFWIVEVKKRWKKCNLPAAFLMCRGDMNSVCLLKLLKLRFYIQTMIYTQH